MLSREYWKKKLKAVLSLDSHPGHIAAGLAVGVFIGITPFFGIHTPMAIAAAFIFRLNKVTTITGAWLNTPLTIVPLLALSYKVGNLMLGVPHTDLEMSSLRWQDLKAYGFSLVVGSSVVGGVASVVAYFACYWLVMRFRRDESLREITREMEEVGEEIE